MSTLSNTPTTTQTTSLPAAVQPFVQMPLEELIARYRRGLECLDPRMFELSDEQLDTAFLVDAGVGNWPCRVLIGHLADAEISFVHRMRRTVAEDRPVLSAWDENAFIDSGLYGGESGGGQHPIAAFLAVIHTCRRWTSGWLLSLDRSAFDRVAMHPVRGEQTVKTILAYTTWHLEHHGRFLNLKIEKMLGPAPAEPCEDPRQGAGGSCGSGCGCHSKKA